MKPAIYNSIHDIPAILLHVVYEWLGIQAISEENNNAEWKEIKRNLSDGECEGVLKLASTIAEEVLLAPLDVAPEIQEPLLSRIRRCSRSLVTFFCWKNRWISDTSEKSWRELETAISRRDGNDQRVLLDNVVEVENSILRDRRSIRTMLLEVDPLTVRYVAFNHHIAGSLEIKLDSLLAKIEQLPQLESIELLREARRIDSEGNLRIRLFKHLEEARDNTNELKEIQKKADDRVNAAVLGIKFYSTVVGGVFALVTILGFSAFNDIRERERGLEETEEKFDKTYESVTSELNDLQKMREYLVSEIDVVRQRSNGLVNAMQKAKNDEFRRLFDQLIEKIQLSTERPIAGLDAWLDEAQPIIDEIGYYLELRNGNSARSSEMTDFESLLNFPSLELRLAIFRNLKNLHKLDQQVYQQGDPKIRSGQSDLSVVDAQIELWTEFRPEDSFLLAESLPAWAGMSVERVTEIDTAGVGVSSLDSSGEGVSRRIAVSAEAKAKDEELAPLVLQAAYVRALVLWNLNFKRHKLANQILNSAGETQSSSQAAQEARQQALEGMNYYACLAKNFITPDLLRSMKKEGGRTDESGRHAPRMVTQMQMIKGVAARNFGIFLMRSAESIKESDRKEALKRSGLAIDEMRSVDTSKYSSDQQVYHNNVIAMFYLLRSSLHSQGETVSEDSAMRIKLDLKAAEEALSKQFLEQASTKSVSGKVDTIVLSKLTGLEIKMRGYEIEKALDPEFSLDDKEVGRLFESFKEIRDYEEAKQYFSGVDPEKVGLVGFKSFFELLPVVRRSELRLLLRLAPE